MKDFYKRLDVDIDASQEVLRQKMSDSSIRQKVRSEAAFILLNPQRRRVYSRNVRQLRRIGKLRANLELNNAPNWNISDFSDFTCESRSAGSILEKLERDTKRRRRKRKTGNFFKRVVSFLSPLIGWIAVIGLCGIFSFIMEAFEGDGDSDSYTESSSSQNYSAPGTYGSGQDASGNSQPDLRPTFDEAAQPLPANGRVWSAPANSVAPLRIVTRSGGPHYFVKVVTPYSERTISTVFVRSGQSATIKLPVGTYELKYAVGDTWYGKTHLFGPNTRYSKADETFQFTRSRGQVYGYTVELYTQRNGNMRTEGISPSEF